MDYDEDEKKLITEVKILLEANKIEIPPL